MIYDQVLITGGAGFIGGHLVHHLIEKGSKCRVVDNLSTGTTDNLDLANSDLDFRCGDVCDDPFMTGAFEDCKLVIHLAAAVGLQNVIADPLRALKTNVEGVRTVAGHAARAGVPLVYVSSSAVYQCGGADGATQYSEIETLHPCGNHCASIYPETKLLGETICEALRSTHNLRYLIVRPFNLIGAKQTSQYGMVVPTFIRQALSGQPMTVFGDGRQTRTFSDVKLGIELLGRLIDETDFDGSVLNLAANDQEISIIELARSVMSVMGREIPIQFIPYDEAYGVGYRDVSSRRPRLERLRQMIGDWHAVPLEQTLTSILEYEMSVRKIENISTYSTR